MCMWFCMCVCVCESVQTHLCGCVCVCIYSWKSECMCMHACGCMSTQCSHVCVWVCARGYYQNWICKWTKQACVCARVHECVGLHALYVCVCAGARACVCAQGMQTCAGQPHLCVWRVSRLRAAGRRTAPGPFDVGSPAPGWGEGVCHAAVWQPIRSGGLKPAYQARRNDMQCTSQTHIPRLSFTLSIRHAFPLPHFPPTSEERDGFACLTLLKFWAISRAQLWPQPQQRLWRYSPERCVWVGNAWPLAHRCVCVCEVLWRGIVLKCFFRSRWWR